MNKQVDGLYCYSPDNPKVKFPLQISKDGRFISGIPSEKLFSSNYPLWNLDQDLQVIPGLIDIHVHGGIGITFGEHISQLEDELRRYSAWAASNGVTGFLCSVAAQNQDQLVGMVEAYTKILVKEMPGAECLGLHLEGPYLSQVKRGGFIPDWLRSPALDELESLVQAGKGWIRQITIAPELAGADTAAKFLAHSGVIAAVGHTDGDYDCITNALSTNFSHVTHTYNAMSAFSHFTPGAVGAVLNSKNATAELIADGIHAHPGALKLVYKCLGPDRLVLITDAMAGAGMPDGVYELLGGPVIVKDGRATRPEDGRLAGGTSTLNHCVCNMVQMAGVPFSESVKMASLTPARVLHLNHRLGSLEAGKSASFVIVDKELRVYQTMVKGRVVYNRN
jgi:N-acetylglucosamine-6-phosphate deacetylase